MVGRLTTPTRTVGTAPADGFDMAKSRVAAGTRAMRGGHWSESTGFTTLVPAVAVTVIVAACGGSSGDAPAVEGGTVAVAAVPDRHPDRLERRILFHRPAVLRRADRQVRLVERHWQLGKLCRCRRTTSPQQALQYERGH